MKAWPVLALLLNIGGASSVLGAQERARVLVNAASGSSAVFEFRPCVPAEGSGCGAWLDHSVDTTAVPVTRSARSSDGEYTISIDRGALRFVRGGKLIRVWKDPRGAATAVTMHPSGSSAFVVLHGNPSARNFIVMFDLETRSSIASTSFTFEPAGVAVIR